MNKFFLPDAILNETLNSTYILETEYSTSDLINANYGIGTFDVITKFAFIDILSIST